MITNQNINWDRIFWDMVPKSGYAMGNWYLDIETTGLDPNVDEIITIQFQRLDFETKKPVGDLIILRAWESSEKDILEQFAKFFGTDEWGFVAHGYNLKFEYKFLLVRSAMHGFKEPIDLFSRPCIDLHPVGVLLNGGKFKGSGLDNISPKNGDGLTCLGHYHAKEYKKVEQYIKQESQSFIKLLVWLTENMPRVLNEFRVSLL